MNTTMIESGIQLSNVEKVIPEKFSSIEQFKNVRQFMGFRLAKEIEK